MEDNRYKLNSSLLLPAADADKLLASGDGNCALLYLYLLRNGSCGSLTTAAEELGIPVADITRAAGTLRLTGLMSGGAEQRKPLPPDDEKPEYTAEDIIRRSADDSGFRGILAETESAMGRALSSADIRTLFAIYDHLGLPAEVITLLLHYCLEEYRGKYGAGRIPTMRFIEKEAFVWANREIMTLDAAEDYLKAKQERTGAVARLRRSLGIYDRELTVSERKYIEGWLDMGFSPEALELAYDRTVMGTGQLKWAYMNKIVLSWDSKHLYTPEDIAAGDSPRKPAPAAHSSGDDPERLKRAFDKLRNGGI